MAELSAERIGMIGTGAMGLALLERLKIAGVPATVYDIDSSALEQARKLGFKIAASAAEVAQPSTLIDVVVRTDEEIMSCVTGPGGVLENCAADTLVLLHSTVLPQTVTRIAESARAKPVWIVDACMSGVPDTVRAGNLCFLVGGSKDMFRRAESHLLNMGKQVFHMGPVGTGAVAKLILNMVIGAETLIVHEAIQIGEAGGIPYPQALEMMRQVEHVSVVHRWQKTFDASGVDPTPKAGRNIMNKDIPLAAEVARLYGLNVPITQQLAEAAARIVKAKASS